MHKDVKAVKTELNGKNSDMKRLYIYKTVQEGRECKVSVPETKQCKKNKQNE